MGRVESCLRRLCVMFVYFDGVGCRIIGFVARSICPLRLKSSALRSSDFSLDVSGLVKIDRDYRKFASVCVYIITEAEYSK